MQYQAKNTLAYFQDAPQYKAVDVRAIPLSVLSASTKVYRSTVTQVSPDMEVIRFYAMNHLASIVRKKYTLHEPLDLWALAVMEDYTHEVASQGQRMLHYLLSIITREVRYLKTEYLKQNWWGEVEQVYGAKFKKFLSSMPHNESTAVEAFMTKPADCSFGQYTRGIAHAFDKGKWGGGYGGEKWGAVAACVAEFAEGHISMEMMVDMAYSLSHNNGPVFDKGMIYDHYHPEYFITLLDVQRSGQMPQLVLDVTQWTHKIPEELKSKVKAVRALWPEEFGTWVNWAEVEAKGAVKSYTIQKAKQEKLHPKGAESVVYVPTGQKIKMLDPWEIYPTQYVQVYERVKDEVAA